MRGDAAANAPSGRAITGWFLLSFLIWLICFQGFVSGKLSLQSDAVGYYQHIKFFIDNMVAGVYPFWDPGINSGVPNEFFLRRMGSFNPFFLIPVALRWCGVPHLLAYTTYLSVYYFVGALGFYYLCRVMVRRPTAAYAGFLIYLFSSLGTRQFDSYIVLVSVPLVWFFAFFIDYFRRPRAVPLLGMTFCLMNLVTTYIPLYFAVIFGSFLIFVGAVFPKECWSRLREGGGFAWRRKGLALICALSLSASLIPAAMIFQSARDGEFVMPRRASTAESTNALAVGKDTVTEWAMLEELVYAAAFSDLRRFKFAVIYFPGFVFLIYLMGACVRLNRKFVFLILWGGFLFLLSVPALSPVYDFLRGHVFLFKYFRNLHWFYWLAMLPIFVLAAVVLLDEMPVSSDRRQARRGWMIWVVIAHAAFTVAVALLGNTIWSTYLMIAVSAVFFILLAYPAGGRCHLTMLLLTLAVGGQSLEVYHYLNVNSLELLVPYKGDDAYQTASYQNTEIMGVPIDADKPSLYYALRNYHDLYDALPPSVLFPYKSPKFILFDEVEEAAVVDYQRLIRQFRSRANRAVVTQAVDFQGRAQPSSVYEEVRGEGSGVTLERSSVNTVRLATDLKRPRFLVFNQNWHPRWHARIDGLSQPVIEANGSFMGLAVPAGPHRVTLRYGSGAYRGLHLALLMLFYGLFVWLVTAAVRARSRQGGAHG